MLQLVHVLTLRAQAEEALRKETPSIIELEKPEGNDRNCMQISKLTTKRKWICAGLRKQDISEIEATDLIKGSPCPQESRII